MIGWTINHISDQITKSKSIMYSSDISSVVYSGPFQKFNDHCFTLCEYTITNLTTDCLFKNINLSVEVVNPEKEDIIYIQDLEADGHFKFLTSETDTVFASKTHFVVEGLHPKTEAKLKVFYKGELETKLFLEYSDDADRNTLVPILLMKSGLRTAIITYQLQIFIILLLIWIILIGLYLYETKIT